MTWIDGMIPFCKYEDSPARSWCANPQHARVTPLTGPNEVGYLAGPFNTSGQQWISVADVFNSEEPSILPPEIDRITSYTGDAVDAAGVAVPYPPLHMHHIHIIRFPRGHRGGFPAAVDKFDVQQHWLETHGDYRLTPPGGAIAPGYTIAMPPGTCRVMGQGAELRLFAEVNDVRPREETAPITFWLRIRMQIADQPCRPIGRVVFW